MKRLLLAVCLAVGIHLALFSIRPQWTPPAVLMPQSRSVAISLVEAPEAPPHKPLPQPEVIKPRPKPRLKPRPAEAPEPDAKVMPVPEPTPLADTPSAIIESNPVDESPSPEEAPQRQTPTQQLGGVIQISVPRYDINPTPVYPSVALRRGYEGTVLLEVMVTPDGRARRVKVVQSSGYAILDRRALATVQKWLFTPALRGTQPVEMKVVVPVVFQLN